ncbi:hypothetical protein BN2497_10653 [Janthinobacterium sp. CG23_2]|nr:hypothetical protein BN2497_10653 [Janthinobacterium sp. CG23_2]CUU31724.1 hypothetical protein BN3177_10653 [Janthinobacterium sp. CG23_2]
MRAEHRPSGQGKSRLRHPHAAAVPCGGAASCPARHVSAQTFILVGRDACMQAPGAAAHSCKKLRRSDGP